MRLAYRDEADWKQHAIFDAAGGFYSLATSDTQDVPVRIFLSEVLLTQAEPTLYRQIVNATRFPGVKLVAITPDVHYGYGVPVGCVILTDREAGALAMGPVGFDIGCGMVSARSDVPVDRATPDRKVAFHKEVMRSVSFGPGGTSRRLGRIDKRAFQELVRGGAEQFQSKHGKTVDRSRAERHCIPVADAWDIPFGGEGRPERGMEQIGSLGGGNHFIELQRCEETQTLFVQFHTGSRGFGHGLATNYFAIAQAMAKATNRAVTDIDLGFFLPGTPEHLAYQSAVAAGGNFAIINRLVLFEAVAEAFEKVFHAPLELIYEISHNLVQAETHPEFGDVWVHRKGATRAFPAGHPGLAGTAFEATGHPVLIPGSNRDESFILRPLPGAVKSGFSVNHGAGRRMSRSEATRKLSQEKVNEQYRRDGILVNLDGEVPLDEASACYKSCREVVDVVVNAGLAEIEYTLFPLASLKGTDGGGRRGSDRRAHKRKRVEGRTMTRALRDDGVSGDVGDDDGDVVDAPGLVRGVDE